MKQFFLALYTLLIVAGCTKSTVDEIIDINKAEFYANIEGAYDSEPDTKTYIDDLIRMRWSANDKISMFNKTTYLREFTFTGKTGANAGGFRQTSTDDEFWYGADVDNIYAVYPYSEDMQIDETSCAITLIMPAEQTYAENSFGLGANTMVAVSTSNQLVFKNVGSWLRVRLYGENTSIASVTLTSLGDEAIAGEAEVTATLNGNPTCVVTGKTKSIKLTCPTPVQISTSADTPTDFWVVVPPVTLKNGLSVTVEDSDGGTQTYEVNKSFTFERNKFYNLKREVEIDHGIPNNQIWYTSTDGNIVTPYNADGFCASIISNTYKNGKGVITFDNDVTIIGSSAFKGCDKLLSITIPTSVTIIGRSAFEGANLFDGTELPDSIISIEDRAFYAANIKRIVLSNSIKTIGVYAFSYCDKLEEIVIPDSVEEIGDEAFYSSRLRKIWLGNGLKYFGFNVFGSTTLYQVHVSNINVLCNIEYKSNSNGDGYSIFEKNTTSLYMNGRMVTDLVIPDGVETLNADNLRNCYSITSVTIPQSVKSVEGRVFEGCSNLTNIKGKFASVDNKCLVIDGVLNSFARNGIQEYNIPDDVSKIPFGPFYESNLTKVTFNNVREIEGSAFYNSKNLTEIIITESVENIGYNAFRNCTNLKNIYCERTTPPSIGGSVFRNNASGRKIYVPASSVDSYKNATNWSNYKDAIVGIVEEQPNNQIWYTSNDNQIVTPYTSNIFGANITSNIYKNGKGIITFDKAVTSIGEFAFLSCKNLSTISIPESVTQLGPSVFEGCNNLMSISLPKKLTSIGAGAFAWCNLIDITIPSGVKAIEMATFHGCGSLISISLPESIESINETAFCYCI